jgi:DNA-binding GntR family transcriptional regulator
LGARGDQAVGSGDSRLLNYLNCQFHDTTRIAGNSVTALLLRQLQRIAWYLESVMVDRASSSWVEHREMLAALEDHDAALASSLMPQHVHRTLGRIDLRRP